MKNKAILALMLIFTLVLASGAVFAWFSINMSSQTSFRLDTSGKYAKINIEIYDHNNNEVLPNNLNFERLVNDSEITFVIFLKEKMPNVYVDIEFYDILSSEPLQVGENFYYMGDLFKAQVTKIEKLEGETYLDTGYVGEKLALSNKTTHNVVDSYLCAGPQDYKITVVLSYNINYVEEVINSNDWQKTSMSIGGLRVDVKI